MIQKVTGPFPSSQKLAAFERSLPKDLRGGTRAKIKQKPRSVGIINSTVTAHTDIQPVLAIHEAQRNPIWYLN
jgi:hypothetical protein